MRPTDGWRHSVVVMVVVVVAIASGREDHEKRTLKELVLRLRHLLLREREAAGGGAREDCSSQEDGRKWMAVTNRQLLGWNHRVALADWHFLTNVTHLTQTKYEAAVSDLSEWEEPRVAEGRKFKVQLFDPDLQRQFWIFNLSSDPRDPNKIKRMIKLRTTMKSVYAKAKVCTDKKKQDQQQQQRQTSRCLSLEPDLVAKMAESRDPVELQALWEGWRKVAGKPQRRRYAEFVQLLNQGARDNGFADYSEYWEQKQFLDTNTDVNALLNRLWDELRPLYLQLQAYVRGKLKKHYGAGIVGSDGTIPVHLLGNMWAQGWDNIFNLVAPFPELLQSCDDADKLLKDRFTINQLFQLSESFYVSMGLPPMTKTFWDKSMLEKPADHEVQCHPSASDLFSPGDFRIKMCTSVTMDYLETIHHEMGHVQYFMAYAHQPTIYRDSPNQGFHEAIGDTAALSVMSKTHLEKLGLAAARPQHGQADEEKANLNQLMQMALTKIAFLPFSLVVDRWRWSVFQGKTLPRNYNRDWWKLRLDLQGVRSPVPRSEEDFDPAAKMHIVGNAPYLCYFVSFVVQFQFYESLCKASGHTGDLNNCDFGNSTVAGRRFQEFMALGASKPWQEALTALTGSSKISAKSMIEYFAPLQQWLQDQNNNSGEKVGWPDATINWT